MTRPVLLSILLVIAAMPPVLGSRQAGTAPSVDPKLYQDLRWRNVGPHRGGRVTAIAGVRSKPCTFYMGATGGGVWKTESCGNLWTPVSDGEIATGSIGAIDVSESNPDVVYVGTGSAAIRSNVIIGRGMYKSTDAGKTWQFIGLRDAGQIGSVIVHPSNPDIVWIAALGSPYGPNAERGIFKTTDGGKTWKKTLFVNDDTGGRILAINYSNPNELYAGMYRGRRLGWDIVSGGPATEGGIYKSTDGGDTWNKLSAGLPQKLIGKIDLDVARSNPRVVYAMIEAPGPEGGLYKSDDAGASWQNVNNDARLRARPFYFHYVDVNPKNENEVWVNELSLHKSTDGGRTFTQVSTPHGDNHGIWFNPDNPSIAIQCNDGGANVTLDGGRSWSSILNQPTAELYMVSVDEQFPYRLYAPQQDNSTIIVPSLPPHSWGYDNAAQAWTQGPGCETGQIHPRPDGSVIWGACKGEVGRYNVATGQEKHTWIYPQNRYGHDPDDIKFRFPRQTVIHVSPHDPKTVYQASHVLHRTTDEGVTWTTISPNLTAREPAKQIVPGSPITRDITGEEVYSSIYSMVESRLERGVLWVGANDGPVHVSRDSGKTWTNVTPKDLPLGGRVQNIEDSPHRKGSAYVAVYRYLREHDLKPYIYVTDDYGKSWSKLTDGANGIPIDHPTRVVREDPDRQGLLYAGTEFGCFVSFDNGRRWQSLQQNLPATPVTDIRVHRKDLVIATMGRSFWIMDNVTPLQQLAGATSVTSEPNGNGSGGASLPPSREASADRRSLGGGGQAGGSVHRLLTPAVAWRTRHAASGGSPDVPEYPGPGARIDYTLAGAPSGDVKLEIFDAKGAVIRTINPPSATPQGTGQGMRASRRGGPVAALGTKDGHNRYVWDLRHSGADGPMVAPGKYQVRLTAGSWSDAKPLEVRIDPRVTADGVTQADLEEQTAFLLKVRDAMAEARALAAMVRESNKDLHAKLVTAEGPYPQPMLIDQLSNIARMVGQADQKIGKEAQTRLDDLLKELAQIRAAVK
ncbi:MAG TPA: hypothetical protein VHI98_25115 [Vicinamibacterales bacterium]|nr:hypothetical protein [Vicinamibacterales bacterium]